MDTLFFAVVNRGKANAVLRKAQEECGAAGGTIFLGEGTIQSKLLEKLGLTEAHKEILMIPATDELCDKLFEMLRRSFMFSKRNKGIAFSIPFKRWQLQASGQERKDASKKVKYSHFCIITIVDKGRGKDCIKAARAAGAKGGTLIHGRGAGIPTDFYFPLVIEPQKDIVMIVTTKGKVNPIKKRISSELELEKTGKGILFILPVIKTSGLFENRSKERRRVTS
jgi:nitrogen regulatory protein PII